MTSKQALPPTNRKSADKGAFLPDYSDADKKKMFETLVLENRLEDTTLNNRAFGVSRSMESLPLHTMSQTMTSIDMPTRGKLLSRDPMDLDHRRKAKVQLPAMADSRGQSSHSKSGSRGVEVGKIMTDIDLKVLNLKELFRRGDPLEERRAASIKIQSLIRGYLARMRMHHYRKGMRDWKWIRCRHVVFLLDILLSNQNKFDSDYQLFRMNRNMKLLHVIFGKWSVVTRLNGVVRREVRAAAQEKIDAKRMQLLRNTFNGLRTVSVGEHSTKYANTVRRKVIDNIRTELSEKYRAAGMYGVVPESEVLKVLHRKVVADFWDRKRIITLTFTFRAFHTVWKRGIRNMKTAVSHRFRVLVGKCFYSWSDYTYLVSMGLDRKRWSGPRKYEIRYNQKRVDTFARMRCKRMVFHAWRGYFAIQYAVKCRYRKKLADFIRAAFMGWLAESKHQHRLRQLTYDNWKGYARLMVYGPFYAWANHVKAIKNKHNEQMRIANSYLRWKWRQKLLRIIKVWRHQALYGRIDGLYSRQMLLKSLGEQKILANSLEKMMADQTLELDECRQMVGKEIEKRKELETQLSNAAIDNTKMLMTNHHFDQEIRRLEAMVEAIIMINPHQVAHLKKMQGSKFKFKDRNVNALKLNTPTETVPVELSDPMASVKNARLATDDELASGAAASMSITETPAAQPSSIPASMGKPEQVPRPVEVGLTSIPEDAEAEPAPTAKGPPPTAAAANNKSFRPTMVQPKPNVQTIADEGSLDSGDASSSAHGVLNVPPPMSYQQMVGGYPSRLGTATTSITTEDMMLLTRAKWLVNRFRNETHHALQVEHTQASLELLEKDPLDEVDETGHVDLDALKLAQRPPLLPTSNNPGIAAVPSSDGQQSTRPFSRLGSSVSIIDSQAPITLPPSTDMLLGIVDFLDSGDTTNFTTTDKRDWFDTLVEMTKSDAVRESSNLGTAVSVAVGYMAQQPGTIPLPPDGEVNEATQFLETLGSSMDLGAQFDIQMLARQSSLMSLDTGVGDGGRSWRDALMQLRVQYRQTKAEQAANPMVADQAGEIAMYKRILKMRGNLENVLQQQTSKYRKKLYFQLGKKYIESLGGGMLEEESSDEEEEADSAVVKKAGKKSELEKLAPNAVPKDLGYNVYAGNLSNIKNETDEDEEGQQQQRPSTAESDMNDSV